MGRPPTRSQLAYEHIRSELGRGRWAVGDSVSAYSLAKDLGISRTPVIEALKRAEAEGLVEIVPQVGCRILAPTPSSLEELFGLRRALEGMAAQAAAKKGLDGESLLRLDGLGRRFEEAVTAGDRRACAEADREFHLTIAGACGLGRVISMTEGIQGLLPELPAAATEADIADHEKIRAALLDRAPRRARLAAESHVARCAEREQAARPTDRTGAAPAHSALVYRNEEEFLATAVGFLTDGAAAGEQVMAVTGRHNREILASHLGRRAEDIVFADSAEFYVTPGETLQRYQRHVVEHMAAGRVRILGEPVWTNRTSSELDAWVRYESLLNVAFAALPVSVVCPYAAAELSEEIVRGARCTHPHVSEAGGTHQSHDYVSPLAFPG